MTTATYGEKPVWGPMRPQHRTDPPPRLLGAQRRWRCSSPSGSFPAPTSNASGRVRRGRGDRRPERDPAAGDRGAAAAVHARARASADPRRRRADAPRRRQDHDGDLSIDSFWSALGVAFVASAVSVVLDVVFGTNDDDAYTLRVIQRIAKRSGERVETDAPGIIYLEIDGLALPVLQRAMRDGNAPNMARWLVDGRLRADRVGDRPLLADRRLAGRASCSARTRTFPRSAGSRRRRRRR